MTDHDRRTFLRSIGAASLGVLAAGCSGDGGESTDEPTDEPTDTATARSETPTDTATATDTATPTETATVTPGEADYTAGPESTSHHDPASGFADMAHWVEDEWQDVQVNRVTEPTRRSLEEAIIGTGPRVVVFETSGTIDLEERMLTIGNDKCWIAGQTAPSPGITLIRGGLVIEANDCVVQHIRSRPGDEGPSPDSLDCIFTQDGTENNVIDHCTAAWSMDEALSIGYDTNNTTVTNCLITEPLHDARHSKGSHGYGSLTGNNAKNVFYAGNVWAHARSRNPRLKTGVEAAVANNVMYNFGEAVNLDSDTVATIVGNAFLRVDEGDPVVEGGRAYVDDLLTEPETPLTTGVEEMQLRPVWPSDAADAISSGDVTEHNLTHAGARPAERTDHDQRTVDQIRERGGEWIDSQEEVGGYPELEENTHELDVPRDIRGGLREWLREHAQQVEPSA